LVVAAVVGLLLALVNMSPAFAQPANDDFDTATIIGGLPFVDSISTADATAAFDDPSCNGNEHTVWYSFTPTQNMTLGANTFGSDYATTLSVYTGTRGALHQVTCYPFAPSQVTFTATANTTYFFMVASECCGNPGGNLVFTLEGPPANDDISGATPLTLNTTVTENAAVASRAPTDPTTCASSFNFIGNTVWFSFTATQSQPLNVDKRGTNYQASVTVMTDLGSGPAVIACATDEFFTGQSAGVRFKATAGSTYFLMVANNSSMDQAGFLQLTIRPAVVATVTINSAALVDSQGVATVTGTLGCSQGVAGASLHVDLHQRISKKLVITGSRDLTNLLCPTNPTGWSAAIVGTNGSFTKGQAEVFLTGSACDPIGCDTPGLSQIIGLQRK
jgi:hypothetical protein